MIELNKDIPKAWMTHTIPLISPQVQTPSKQEPSCVCNRNWQDSWKKNHLEWPKQSWKAIMKSESSHFSCKAFRENGEWELSWSYTARLSQKKQCVAWLHTTNFISVVRQRSEEQLDVHLQRNAAGVPRFPYFILHERVTYGAARWLSH